MSKPPAKTLMDVLAAISSSVAHGRRSADAEVARVARLYQHDEYLQGMSVPRLRLQQVTIDLPLVCLGVTVGAPCKVSTPEFIAKAVIADTVKIEKDIAPLQAATELQRTLSSLEAGGLSAEGYKVLSDVFTKLGEGDIVGLSDALTRQYAFLLQGLTGENMDLEVADVSIKERVADFTESLVRGKIIELIRAAVQRRNPAPVDGGSQALETETNRLVQEIMASATIRDLVRRLRKTAENAAIEIPSVTPNLEVEVNTEEVKNSANAGAVTRLRLSLSEDGLEWSSETDAAGSKSWRLLPE